MKFSALLLSLVTCHLSLAAAAPAAAHSLYLDRDLRTATLVSVAPDPAVSDAWTVLAHRPGLPVAVTWLYDGALPDPFPRNPRTDPAYAVASTPAVSTVVAFDWPPDAPAGPGPLRVFEGDPDAPLRCLGTAPLPPDAAPGAPVSVILPSAFGLSATRVRTAFQPSPDRSSATESWEIALRNDSARPVSVAVVESRLRSPDWELVACSVPRAPDPSPAVLRLETTVPPSATRTLSFTLRYAFPGGPGARPRPLP